MSKLTTPLNITENITEKILVACSGGVDSVVLAHMLAHAARDKSLITLAHVDHAQHSASKEYAYFVCKTLAPALGVAAVSERLTLAEGASEDELREARYAALAQMCARVGATAVYMAHHQDDQLETYLFKVMRGTHPQSLKGLKPDTTVLGVHVLRPLLNVSKEEIIAYAQHHSLSWREDPSNTNTRFARNAIRHELVPLLERMRPGAAKKFLRYFEEAGTICREKISADNLNAAPENQRWNELRQSVLKELGKDASRTTRAQWDTLLKVLESTNEDGSLKRVQFPGGLEVIFHRGRVSITRSLP